LYWTGRMCGDGPYTMYMTLFIHLFILRSTWKISKLKTALTADLSNNDRNNLNN
jgi:hypothetical protein